MRRLTAGEALPFLEAYYAELAVRLPGYVPPTKEEQARDMIFGLFEDDVLVATGSLRHVDESTIEIKRMFVASNARGRGLGRAMLHALERQASALAVTRIVLDTAATLTEAIALYQREGYVAIERYNDNPVAAHWFEKRLPNA